MSLSTSVEHAKFSECKFICTEPVVDAPLGRAREFDETISLRVVNQRVLYTALNMKLKTHGVCPNWLLSLEQTPVHYDVGRGSCEEDATGTVRSIRLWLFEEH